MSRVIIAESPNLSFIVTGRSKNGINNCPLPLIIKAKGAFDWDANAFITHYCGGSEIYNIRPLATTAVKKAYSLKIFCDFIENKKTSEIDDSDLYAFVEILKDRAINDSTIITHVRLALNFIVYLSKKHPQWELATDNPNSEKQYKVHYSVKTFRAGNVEKKYTHHRCLDGLIHIAAEAEIIHDYELIQWLDAIKCTSHHPNPSNFVLSRWHAFTTILEITGSRISEVHQITRTMIKNAAQNLLKSEKMPVIRNIPILKGKYKGKTRQVTTTKEDIQVVLLYVNLLETKFPKLDHDHLFVDADYGTPIKASYLKNYAKKVINGSKYRRDLRNLSNHSFRHRFITLFIAKELKKLASSGSFASILNVAATACRKITMHASDSTLSRYIHLASELNHKTNDLSDALQEVSSQIRSRVNKLLNISESFKVKQINEHQALEQMISNIEELRKLQLP